MTSEIHRLPIERVKHRFDPHPPLVAMLEEMLKLAQEGKLQACAVAAVYHDHLEPGGEVGEGWHAAPGTHYALSHCVGRLHHKWFASVLRDNP